MTRQALTDDILDQIGEEFADRVRRGENPTVSEYATRFDGEEAKEVADFLDSIAMLEKAKKEKSPPPSSDAPPKDFGRYHIERTLGEGGMGAVYLAHDSQLDRKVALKTPKFSGNADPTMMKRFYREARSAATLQHPNICPVYDVGEIDGIHYISMAFIEGRPLSDLVRAKKQPPVASILRVVRKVAIALHEAHSQGLIHRDLKPANIMIDRRNEPIVMDFGLARQFDDETPESGSSPKQTPPKIQDQKIEARITMDGTVMGSPGYMAPEQLYGDHSKIGPVSDVYALGVLLYELLTGQLPFPGTGSLMSIVNSVIKDPPPDATQVRSHIDAEVAAVCRKAMAKKIGDRYESMQAFAVALTGLLKTEADDGQPAVTGIVSPSSSPELVRVKEQYELAKSLYQEGQYAAAVSIMEKMVAGDSANQYAEWAESKLPKARAKAEQSQKDDAPYGEELWNIDTSEKTLPPRRTRSKSGRKKSKRSATKTIVMAAAGVFAVLIAAVAIRNVKRSMAQDSPKIAAANQDNTSDQVSAPAGTADSADSSGSVESESDPAKEGAEEPVIRRPFRNLTPAEIRNMSPQERISLVDANDDGELTLKELTSIPRIAQNGVFGRIIDNFEKFDLDTDGALDQFEQGRVAGLFSKGMQNKGVQQPTRQGPSPGRPNRPGRMENRKGPRPNLNQQQ